MKTQNDDTCKMKYTNKTTQHKTFVPEPLISFLSNCTSMHAIFIRTNKK